MNTSENKFSILSSNRIVKAFWTLNDEMKPAYKVTFVREIDASAMDRLRQNILRQTSVKPSYTAFVIKAAAMALQEHPYANRALLGFSFWKRFVQFNRFDITVAVERNVPNAESVVLAATILECDKKSLADLTCELVELSNATEDSNPRWRLFYSLLSKVPVFFSKCSSVCHAFSQVCGQHIGAGPVLLILLPNMGSIFSLETCCGPLR